MDETSTLQQISRLIATHSGIHVRPQDYKTLSEKLWQRARTLGLSTLNGYYQRLVQELNNPARELQGSIGQEGLSEWQELYSILTINESYFFRDKNQYRLLQENLLPRIIQRKRQEAEVQGSRPRLRVWSAGCSTGEELYSIAIVLDEMQFPWHQWDVMLIGSDISQSAVNYARKGIYSSWSFRQVPPNIQQKYFHARQQLFQINDTLRQYVTFQYGNLLKDPFPNQASRLYDLDLILCRNVFIYLDEWAISQIIHKFHQSLIPDGYLITGHTELYAQDTTQFHLISFPESIVYQKQAHRRSKGLGLPPAPNAISSDPLSVFPTSTSPTAAASPAANRRSASPHSSIRPSNRSTARSKPAATPSSLRPYNPPQPGLDPNLETALKEAETLLRKESYTSAIERAKAIFSTHPHCDRAYAIAAQAYANMGHYDQAKQLCQQVLQRQPMNVEIYYLLAQIAEDQNELEIAKNHLRKITYLDHGFVNAYLDLAIIYERERQPEKAQKMRSHALDLLSKLPPDTVLDAHNGTTAGQWRDHLQKRSAAS
ncbi:CheR family methyltransferase [Phormidium sp. FACHB-1136]|uniref:CheR family methyltransferase n=1 Tax=Phormidium sp. FACHB-1136 TaxID=2692848 RepID=UPI001681E545|nr:CheR family methyltransferase [Phormidium sp. FACHB-1136]MBD2424861.1 tetratricopeptide repeat protein [Phormidium sp. FACHB-1136]